MEHGKEAESQKRTFTRGKLNNAFDLMCCKVLNYFSLLLRLEEPQ